MSNKDLTIIITTFKSEDNIEKCLNSIDPSVKVIVVENSSNNVFKRNIENKFSNVDCILTSDNLGYGRANNIGLNKVETNYSLILNPDTVLSNDTLRTIAKPTRIAVKFKRRSRSRIVACSSCKSRSRWLRKTKKGRPCLTKSVLST